MMTKTFTDESGKQWQANQKTLGGYYIEPIPAPPQTEGGITGWVIGHPGNGSRMVCATFEECMDKWFEGFNVPVLHIEGQAEPFSKAHKRVEDYFNKKAKP